MVYHDQIFQGDFDTLRSSIQNKLRQFGDVETEYDEIKGRIDFKYHNFWSIKPNMFNFSGNYITTKIADNQYTINIQVDDNILPKIKKMLSIAYIIAILLYAFTAYQLYRSPVNMEILEIVIPMIVFLGISGVYLLFQFFSFYVTTNLAEREFKRQLQPPLLELPFKVHWYSLKLQIFFVMLAIVFTALTFLSLNYLIMHFLARY